MKLRFLITFIFLCATLGTAFAQAQSAPGGTLRAVYLGSNPAQAVRDSATGEIRGASADLAREFARRSNKSIDLKAAANPPAVIEAVKSGQADIGFVAYEATRVGTVEFSQTYMLVQQSFLVLNDSPIRALADVDRSGQKIAGTRNDSSMLCLKRVLKQATPVELENDPAAIAKALTGREIDALGASRQRLTNLTRSIPGSRVLTDTFFNVPQNIVVPMGNPEALAAVNAFIDDVRASGFLRDAITKGGAVGVEAATAGPVSRYGCPG
jgi:polar amino acid transport system substrate-binding protein